MERRELKYMKKQTALYPFEVMNISQSYKGNYSHAPNLNGYPRDYPIDEKCTDTGRGYMVAPCDVKIVRITGVGTNATNTIWLESLGPVITPIGERYINIMAIHPEDDDLKNLKVGKIFNQGTRMFREGKDGKASGNHIHMSVASGKFQNNGWVQNSKGAWIIKGTAIKPEEAFFIGKKTKVINMCGLKFLKENVEDKEVIEKAVSQWFGLEIKEDTIKKDGSNYTGYGAIKKAGLGVKSEGGKPIVFMPEMQVLINGQERTVKGSNLGGTVYTGIREIAEALGAKVGFKNGIVTIDMERK